MKNRFLVILSIFLKKMLLKISTYRDILHQFTYAVQFLITKDPNFFEKLQIIVENQFFGFFFVFRKK